VIVTSFDDAVDNLVDGVQKNFDFSQSARAHEGRGIFA
jgi:hypothetical protein